MTEKQINKWLRRQFSPVGWTLIGFGTLMNLLVMVTMGVDLARQALWNVSTGNFLTDFDWNTVWNNGWGYIAANVTIFVILVGWKGKGYWGRILKRKAQRMNVRTVFTMMCLSVGAQFLNSLWIMGLEWISSLFGSSVMPVLESVSGASDSFSMFLYGAVFAPVAEELLFRGFVLESLRPYGKRFAILTSAILFGAFHGNLLQAPYAFVMGLLLGYLATEYSLKWAIGLHLFNNLILAEGLTRLTEQLPVMLADGIFSGLFLICSILSVVILVRNRSVIRQYRENAWIDRRCMKCFFTSFGVLAVLLSAIVSMISYM